MSSISKDVSNDSPHINEKEGKEPSLLDQLLPFGDDLIGKIDQLVLASYAEAVTSDLREEESTTDDGIDTVLAEFEKLIRLKEKKKETRDDESVASDKYSVSPILKRLLKEKKKETRDDESVASDKYSVSPILKRLLKEKKNDTRVDYSVGDDESVASDKYSVSPILKRLLKENNARARVKPEDDYLHLIRRNKENAIVGDLYEI